jgi:hypothetical protein
VQQPQAPCISLRETLTFPSTTQLDKMASNKLLLVLATTLLIMSAQFQTAEASIIAYGICQTGCNGVAVACYAAFGVTFFEQHPALALSLLRMFSDISIYMFKHSSRRSMHSFSATYIADTCCYCCPTPALSQAENA